MKKTILIALTTILIPACSFAVDGVVLINQSTVLAAGGFPYTISQPGSYKLTGNLTVPPQVNGIQINVSNVALDLNGFTISGARAPSVGNTALIVTTANVQGIAIRNGTLFGDSASLLLDVRFSSSSILEDLVMFDAAGGNQSNFGSGAVARHISNPSGNLFITCPAVVVDSIAFIFLRLMFASTACTLANTSGLVE